MPTGCTNINAVNYDPAATENDRSCVFLVKHNGQCYAFQEIAPSENKSYTLSYSFDGKDWVFFHDYIADFYFHTKTDLYSVKNNRIYRHNTGAPGKYYSAQPSSFFIDAVFQDDEEMILNSVQWVSEVTSNEIENEFTTLTHITIWNSGQCTGRIPIVDLFKDLEYTVFKNKANWYFNDFKDLVKQKGVKFLKSLFENFAVDETMLDENKPWFEKENLQDNYFIVRFEYDNTSGKQLILHEVGLNISKSTR